MAEDNTEIFIDTVKKFPCLYDPQNEGYKDIEVKRNAWTEVVKITGLKDDSSAKLKWKRLRDYYRDCLRKLKTTTGQAPKKMKRWSYMDQMEFLRPTLMHPNTQSNIASDEEMEENNETETHRSGHSDTDNEDLATPRFNPRNNKTQTSKPTTHVVEEYFKKKMADKDKKPVKKCDTGIFFEGISETVKKLPPLSQSRIKMQISQLVFAEEQRVLESLMYSENRQPHYSASREALSSVQPQGCANFPQNNFTQQRTYPQYYNLQPYSPASVISEQYNESLLSPTSSEIAP
ncbi:hypothetical protein RI129_002660 [Pyrocoelia pectoralis]|uniref:MADF domain-containing protein n=1 Tax=Pyrocoelia pectoralis TaxID=417401 RepID=A0AAN7ZTX0_9COLE